MSQLFSPTEALYALKIAKNDGRNAKYITKDIFDTFAAFDSGTAPGSGQWSLSLNNSSAGTTVSLPPIQTIWVRDTLAASDSGSILGISNTVVQLPEPSSLAYIATVLGLGGVMYRRRRA